MLRLLLVALLAWALPTGARADCSTGDCISGGGDPTLDCAAEFTGTGLRLNSPFPDPGDPGSPPSTEMRCFDGDAGCDRDGVVNGVCRFPVDVCVFNNDPNLVACAPSEVSAVSASGADMEIGALDALLAGLALPASVSTCTDGGTVDVAVANPDHAPTRRTRTGTLTLQTTATAGVDDDTLTLTCLPRLWPSHGYSHYNTRATETSRITPENVSRLQMKWEVMPGTVSSTPTVTEDKVFVSSWDGVVYALDRETGAELWTLDTGSTTAPGALGVQSSVTVLPDGRVVVGDSHSNLWALDGETGQVLWSQLLGDENFDHIWASPTAANGRVFMGIASHNDQPCTNGRLIGVDLDTGNVLWTTRTAPDLICEDETETGCTVDGDCPSGRCVGQCTGDRSIPCQDDTECTGNGTCGTTVGGGVTATTATDLTGETVFMVSVGCFTSPRVGNSDRIFSLGAEDGVVDWAQPDFAGESFVLPPGATSYQDYGFLNGPIVVNDPAEPKIVAAGKDGFLYARDPVSGAEIWTNDVGNVNGAFGGFGLFNGAPAFAEDTLFTSLYQFGDGGPAGIVHSQAFGIGDGVKVWDASLDIESTFGSVGYAGGVVFMASSDFFLPGGTNGFFAFAAADGTHLQTFDLPNEASSGPSIVDDELFIGYGLVPPGGMRAYELAAEGVSSKTQQKCVNEVNKRFAGVAKSVGKEFVGCLKARAKGSTSDDLAVCVAGDAKGKIGKARAKTTSGDGKKCGGVASGDTAGYIGDADSVNDAAEQRALAALTGVFGDPDGAVLKSADKDGAKCQQDVAKRLTKLVDTFAKEANKAKKSSLKASTAASGTDELSAAVATAAASSKVAKAAQKLQDSVASKCAGLDLATLFPSACGASADLGACATQCALFHVCTAIDLADSLVVDCEQLAGGACS